MESGNFEGGKLEAAHCKLQGLPSMCGGDAAFCQINLTTCYYEQLGGRNFLVNVASSMRKSRHARFACRRNESVEQ